MGLVLLPVLLIFVFLFLWKGEEISGKLPGCPILEHTGFYCPGCGGTRAFHALMHLRVMESAKLNLGIIAFFLLYFFFMVNTALVKKTKKAGFAGFPVTYAIFACMGVMIIQCIIRNLLL